MKKRSFRPAFHFHPFIMKLNETYLPFAPPFNRCILPRRFLFGAKPLCTNKRIIHLFIYTV